MKAYEVLNEWHNDRPVSSSMMEWLYCHDLIVSESRVYHGKVKMAIGIGETVCYASQPLTLEDELNEQFTTSNYSFRLQYKLVFT